MFHTIDICITIVVFVLFGIVRMSNKEVIEVIEYYKKRIKELEVELKSASENDEYKRISVEIKNYQEALDARLGE